MSRKLPELMKIEGTEPVSFRFLLLLQNGLLLGLQERGSITAMQLRYAQEKLKQQRRDRAKEILENES